jgi:hypothetical protein
VAAGAVLGVTAALWAGRPGSLWRPLLIGLSAYAAGGALVLRWGLEVYGTHGALAATALAAFTPGVLAALAAPPQVAPAGATTLAGSVVQVAALYALMRCLLDPALTWAALAGVAIVAVPVGAFLHGAEATPLVGLAVLSVVLVACRVLTSERSESRARVAQASAVSVALAWSVALGVVVLIAALSDLPSAEEYSALRLRAAAQALAMIASPSAAPPLAGDGPSSPTAGPPTGASGLAVLPLVALLLAAVRPWRRERRFTDAGWSADLICIGGVLWWAWGAPGGVFMAPIAALLAGACWDASRPAWARRAATVVVVMQLAAVLLLWPRYPGGVRSDAWLPMPGSSLPRADEP